MELTDLCKLMSDVAFLIPTDPFVVLSICFPVSDLHITFTLVVRHDSTVALDSQTCTTRQQRHFLSIKQFITNTFHKAPTIIYTLYISYNIFHYKNHDFVYQQHIKMVQEWAYFIPAGYATSLGFPIMHQLHTICTHCQTIHYNLPQYTQLQMSTNIVGKVHAMNKHPVQESQYNCTLSLIACAK